MSRVVVIASLVTLAGCPFGSDEDGDPTKYVAMSQIDSAYKDARCTYLARCGLFPDKATCLGAALTNDYPLFQFDDQVRASVLAGRVRYNGNRVKTCFDAIAAATCDTTDENGRVPIAECNPSQIIAGTVTAGGDCVADVDCVSGVCTGNSDAPSCTTGKCVGDAPPPPPAPAQLNEQCTGTSTSCAKGLYCDPASYTCQALKIAGATCNDLRECQYGLGCVGTSTRTCKALPAVGEPCPDGVCRDYGTACKTSGATATCVQVGLAGAQCTSFLDCSEYYPCDFAASQCKVAPAIGESCASNYRCFAADAYCDTSTTTCTAVKADGSPCNGGNECMSRQCVGGSGGLACGEEPSLACP